MFSMAQAIIVEILSGAGVSYKCFKVEYPNEITVNWNPKQREILLLERNNVGKIRSR